MRNNRNIENRKQVQKNIYRRERDSWGLEGTCLRYMGW